MSDHVDATSAPLLVASLFLGDTCRAVNDAYMRCRKRTSRRGDADSATYDPRACQPEAAAVLACTRRFFTAVSASPCVSAWRAAVRCTDANNLNALYCRREGAALERCLGALGSVSVDGVDVELRVPRLWVGTGADGAGSKPAGTCPEDGRIMYAWHVLRHRRPYTVPDA